MPSQIGNPKSGCPNKDPEEKEEKQDPKKHWIKFTTKDEKGSPVSGVALQITLPDGSVVEKASDKQGLIEVKNIEPGNCTMDSDWRDACVFDSVLLK